MYSIHIDVCACMQVCTCFEKLQDALSTSLMKNKTSIVHLDPSWTIHVTQSHLDVTWPHGSQLFLLISDVQYKGQSG